MHFRNNIYALSVANTYAPTQMQRGGNFEPTAANRNDRLPGAVLVCLDKRECTDSSGSDCLLRSAESVKFHGGSANP